MSALGPDGKPEQTTIVDGDDAQDEEADARELAELAKKAARIANKAELAKKARVAENGLDQAEAERAKVHHIGSPAVEPVRRGRINRECEYSVYGAKYVHLL